MSIFMVLVMGFAIIDAAYALYTRILTPPLFILDVSDLLDVFTATLVVLIAIEIYTNATLYLAANVIHVTLIVATALMAIARKVITLDTTELDPLYFWATPVLVWHWVLPTGCCGGESSFYKAIQTSRSNFSLSQPRVLDDWRNNYDPNPMTVLGLQVVI